MNSSSDNSEIENSQWRCLRPGYPLILHKALATWPVSASIPNAKQRRT